MNIISVMFPNDLAEVTVDKGEGVQVLIGKAEGKKGKINRSSRLFRSMLERGSIVEEL